MLRRENKGLLIVLWLLCAAACGLMLLGPALAVIGCITWFIAMLTRGAVLGGVGLDPLFWGLRAAGVSVWLVPVSLFTMAVSILQYRRFRTTLAIPVAVLAGVHLLLSVAAVFFWKL